jgi:hypothetical protein
MRVVSRITTPLWMSTVVVFVACGGSTSSQGTANGFGSSSSSGGNNSDTADSTTGSGDDGSSGGYNNSSSSSSSSSGGGGACMAKCSVDSDCQSACPSAPSGSSYCCMAGECYLSPASTCPDMQDAGTEDAGLPPI